MTQIELRVQRKEMEVVMPAPELHFHTATTTPYMSAPSSPPKSFGSDSCFFTSAPTSPSAAAAFYATLRDIAAAGSDWEEMPGNEAKDLDFDFDAAFNFSGGSATPPTLTDADDLFEFGIIRPLKLPPRLCTPATGEQSPKSPRARGLLPPLRRGRGGKEVDPFTAAMLEVTRSRKGSRFLSPLRGRGGFFHTPKSSPSHPVVNNPCARKGGAGSRKWRLKDLLLFRAPRRADPPSEGSKDHLCKYTSSSSSSSSSQSSMKRNKVSGGEDSMSSSFRSSVDSGSVRQEGATAEEMKKKMTVQRRQSIFSQFRLAGTFVRDSFNRGSLNRGRS